MAYISMMTKLLKNSYEVHEKCGFPGWECINCSALHFFSLLLEDIFLVSFISTRFTNLQLNKFTT